MKKKVLILLTMLTLVCFVGCSSNEQATAGDNKQDISAVEPTKEAKPEVTTEPSSEPEDEVTEETTPEATEEPIVYEGIDMESTLPGEEWMATFEGIITEPKLVVFNDETGRKEIIENDETVNFNPDVDYFGVYLPKGATVVHNRYKGIDVEEVFGYEYCEILKLEAESSRKYGRQSSAIYVEFNSEEIALTFDFRPE